MDQHPIDHLFREKLDGVEITPTSQAWSEVEKQIGGKKKPILYWVAASITLCLLSWMVWPDQGTKTPFSVVEINHPTLPNETDLTIPVAVELTDEVAEKEVRNSFTSAVQKKIRSAEFADDNSIEELSNYQLSKIPELKKKTRMTLGDALGPLPDKLRKSLQEEGKEKMNYEAVKITYIATNNTSTNEQITKKDTTGVLRKFITLTGKIDPGEMLADIKTAKDNLLNGGLKSKKERSAMTP